MIGLKIGGVPEHFNLPWRMAIEEGRFREAGIQLHWSDMGGGTGQMIRGLEKPKARSASTNASSLSEKNSLRTSLKVVIQPVTANTKITLFTPCPSKETKINTRIN